MEFTIEAYPTDIWKEDSGTIKVIEIDDDDSGDVYARFISEDMQKKHAQFDSIFSMHKRVRITIEVLEDEE